MSEKVAKAAIGQATSHGAQAIAPVSKAGVQERTTWNLKVEEIELEIYSHFTVRDLLRIRVVSQHFRKIANILLAQKLNEGSIELKDIGVISLEGLIQFFGEERRQLTRLDLRSGRGNMTRAPLTDDDLLKISKHFGHVKHLLFKESYQTAASEPYYAAMAQLETVVADAFCKVSTLNFLKASSKLKSLRIEHSVANIADITALGGCPELEVFYSRGGSLITDITCLGYCKKLKEIVLSGWSCLADVSALKECSVLEKVNMFMCVGVKNIDFFKETPTLKKICLQGCRGISSDQQQYFRKAGLLTYISE